jgi:hypothetical protein
MKYIKSAFAILSVLSMLAACKQKKVSMTGDEPVTASDFINAFPTLSLPFRLTDSGVNKKSNDSLLISHKIFTQFVPDSVFNRIFGKGVKPKVHVIGKTNVDKKENYLLIKAIQGTKKAAYILCFDKDNRFSGYIPFLVPDQSPATGQSSSIDKNYTIIKSIVRKNPDGTISDGKDVYVFNADSRSFMLIMTDALDEKPAEVINPIDTLARKNKFSADYVKSKTDYVSVRDTRKPDRVIFFIHSDKNNGECVAELKGEATLASSGIATYRAGGDPCHLQLSFSSSSVTLKEIEGCGSHRGLRCLFEGTYPRKKVSQTKKPKKKSSASR